MADLQLTVFGGFELLRDAEGRRRRLSRSQELVVRWMATHAGEIRSTRAGVIAHTQRRPDGCKGATASSAASRWTPGGRSHACCPWAATDGWALLRRLAERGIVEKVERGRWRLREGGVDGV